MSGEGHGETSQAGFSPALVCLSQRVSDCGCPLGDCREGSLGSLGARLSEIAFKIQSWELSSAALSWHQGWVVGHNKSERSRGGGAAKLCLPSWPSGPSPVSHRTQKREGQEPGPWRGWRGPAVRGAGSTGPAPAPPLPALPIGPESGDSRAEQEGNRSPSERRRRRLQAVQLQLPPLTRQFFHRQHERPARLQHVGHRVPRSEFVPGAHAGGKRGHRDPPPG